MARDDNDLLVAGDLPPDPEQGGVLISLPANSLPPRLPLDAHAERGMVGAVLHVNGEGFTDYGLTGDHFADPGWRAVWETIGAMVAQGRPADAPSVVASMQRAALPLLDMVQDADQYRGALAIYHAATEAPDDAVVAGYRQRVVEMALRRRAILNAEHLMAMARSPAGLDALNRAWDEAGEELRSRPGTDREYRSVGEVAKEVVDHAWRFSHGDRNGVFPTGMSRLDIFLDGGFVPGDLVIVGGRPAMGKSSFALSIARKASRVGTGVLILSLELMESIACRRILSQETRQPSVLLKRGFRPDGQVMSDQDYCDGMAGAERLCADPLWIMDRPSQSLADVRSVIRRVKSQHVGLGIIIIDYLQIMAMQGGRNQSTSVVIGDVAQALRNLAKAEGVAIMALSQLNRATETNRDQKPTLANLRDSGAIEAAATVVLFPWREILPNAPSGTPAILIVAKATDGKTGEVPFTWHSVYQEFVEEEEQRAARDTSSWIENAYG